MLTKVAEGTLVHRSELLQNNTVIVGALRDGRVPDDPRIGPSAAFGSEWLPDVDEWQRQRLAADRADTGRDGSPM